MSILAGPSQELAALLGGERDELLDDWLNEQRERGVHRPDLLDDERVRDDAARLLQLVEAALSNAAPLERLDADAWSNLREFLEDLVRRRAADGFSPNETAGFVMSLRLPLFRALRRVHDEDVSARLFGSFSVLVDRLGLFASEQLQREREAVIERQRQEMFDLSTPIVELWEGILCLPLIGTLDSRRTQHVMEHLLERIAATRASFAVIDITGVPIVDTLTAQHLTRTASAVRLMGAECIVSGIRPQIARTIVELGADFHHRPTASSLADALAYAFRHRGVGVAPLNAGG